MLKSKSMATRLVATAAAGVAMALSGAAISQELPKTMVWTSYDVGSAGYAEASAMADAFGKKYGVKIRIMPSGSSIGRLQPVLTNRADVGWLATETFFAAEGTEDFAAKRWGPQDLRVLAGRPASFGLPAAADAGIKTFADLKGKRAAFVAGNPSVNVKCEAYLGFGGLTLKDVEVIMFPTYGAAMSSIAQGKSDFTCTTTTPSQMYELAESPRGITWIGAPAEDKEGWARMQAIAPYFGPGIETVGAGISKEKPAALMSYRYPLLAVRSDMTPDEAYAFVKAMDETYDLYKDATAVMPRWNLTESGPPPADAPYHEGAIRYLKEKGIWTAEHDKWNNARLARLNALLAAWEVTMDTGMSLSDKEFAALWTKNRQAALASLK
jgi:TRAP transporter TAXI family solute receptor